MDALTARTPLDLTDYAAALPSTPADSVVAIGLKGSRLGPVMRLDDVAAPATMAGVIAASAGIAPEDAVDRTLRAPDRAADDPADHPADGVPIPRLSTIPSVILVKEP